MNSSNLPSAVACDDRPDRGTAGPSRGKRKAKGLLLCLAAAGVAIAGWTWAGAGAGLSTDNAYVRGDVTSLAPKVAGYVTAVHVRDNQAVQAGDVLFRIDDRDHRARLAQAAANVEAAWARLDNVDEEIQLQQALVRQAHAQRRAMVAEMELAVIDLNSVQ